MGYGQQRNNRNIAIYMIGMVIKFCNISENAKRWIHVYSRRIEEDETKPNEYRREMRNIRGKRRKKIITIQAIN